MKTVTIDFGSGKKKHKVVEQEKLVSLTLESRGAIFSPISFLKREQFEKLREKWKKEFDTGYLGKFTAQSREEGEKKLRKAIDFWRKAGFSVVTRNYEIAEVAAKIYGGKRETIAVPFTMKGDTRYNWMYEIASGKRVRKKSESKSRKKKKTGKTIKPAQHQTGRSKNLAQDKKLKALTPGKRISRSGKVYYEYRQNRSDLKGGV